MVSRLPSVVEPHRAVARPRECRPVAIAAHRAGAPSAETIGKAEYDDSPVAKFLHLAPEELVRLKAIAEPINLEPERSLFVSGDPAIHTFLIASGTLRIFKALADGRRIITAFAWAGDFLGFSVDDAYTYDVEAITPAKLCRFSRRRLTALLDDCPDLRNRLLHFAGAELHRAQDRMVVLGRKTARERLASFLLQLAQRCEQEGPAPNVVPLPMSRGDIADYLGLTSETVSRVFTQLKQVGLIAFSEPRHVVLLRRDKLLDETGGFLEISV